MMTQTDELVAAYLARVERAASRLPAARREELLGDLREHIEIARAESETGTEAEVRTILDRLGDPESIVAAADTQTELPPVTPAPPPPPWTAPPRPAPARSGSRVLWLSLAGFAVLSMLALCLGTALFLTSEGDGPAPVVPAPADQAPQPTSTGP